MDTNIRISRMLNSKGSHTVFAFTNWRDDVSSHPQKLNFQFKVTGKSGAWHIECKALNFTTTERTLREVDSTCEGAVHDLYNHKLDQIEVWRNSGGFLCIGGWCGKNWYVYASKAPYDAKWTVTSEFNGMRFRDSGESLPCLIGNVCFDITQWEKQHAAQVEPIPQVAQPTPAQPPTETLKAAFQQAEAHAQWVVSKNDFSPTGELEFLKANQAVRNAYNALWYAEQKQWGTVQ